MILSWLEDRPDLAAKELFQRLQRAEPDVYSSGQLRTLQRRVKEWRHGKARELVLASCSIKELAGAQPTDQSQQLQA